MSKAYIVKDAQEVPWRKSTFAEGVYVKDLGSSDGQAMQLGRYGGINEDFVLVDGWRKGEAESL
jgi:hypothetical protein